MNHSRPEGVGDAAGVPENRKAEAMIGRGALPDDVLCVDYDRLIPVLIEAVKEQQTQIDKLQKQIAKLEKQD